MGCKCKENINISGADIKIRDLHRIDIRLTREPDTPLIKELRNQIAELNALGLKFQEIDQRLAEALETLDIPTKAYLAELLEDYASKDELETLRQELMAWADSRFLRKVYLSQAAFDALPEKDENVIYVII